MLTDGVLGHPEKPIHPPVPDHRTYVESVARVTQSCPTLCDPMDSLSLLQQIFPTQKSNWDLLHCKWILYQLSYQGRPAIQGSLEVGALVKNNTGILEFLLP